MAVFTPLSHLKLQCVLCLEKNESSLECAGHVGGKIQRLLDSIFPSCIQLVTKSCQFFILSCSQIHLLVSFHMFHLSAGCHHSPKESGVAS